MILSKKYLEVFFLTLQGTETVLSLKDARVRDSILRPVREATDLFYEDRKKIYEAYCRKNEDGTPFIKNDLFHFDKEKVPEMNKEIDVLLAEEVEIPLTCSAEKLKEIIESTEYKPKAGESVLIDELIALIK